MGMSSTFPPSFVRCPVDECDWTAQLAEAAGLRVEYEPCGGCGGKPLPERILP